MRFENLTHFRNYFNWTMTYRRDADIPLLYGRVKSHQQDSKSEVNAVRHDRASFKTSFCTVQRFVRKHHSAAVEVESAAPSVPVLN